ncbi:MAG TPA: hypothetical protein VFX86_03880 [Candidatus Saccharimonadales bacterium]|nr:hypothetical protein [Candidatus Saccharimonadales bacterium]
MKQKDILTIAVIAIFAGVFSLVISNIFFTSGDQRKLTAETAQPITAEFKEPDKTVFNERAINPTKLIQIGNANNPEPF